MVLFMGSCVVEFVVPFDNPLLAGFVMCDVRKNVKCCSEASSRAT
jgi:hypothetical protein